MFTSIVASWLIPPRERGAVFVNFREPRHWLRHPSLLLDRQSDAASAQRGLMGTPHAAPKTLRMSPVHFRSRVCLVLAVVSSTAHGAVARRAQAPANRLTLRAYASRDWRFARWSRTVPPTCALGSAHCRSGDARGSSPAAASSTSRCSASPSDRSMTLRPTGGAAPSGH